MEWRNDDDTAFTVHVDPEPPGPLSVGQHLLFAFLLVAVLALGAWLTIAANGAGR